MRAAVHAGGDFNFQLFLFPEAAFAVAGRAGFGHKLLHALATGTGGGDLKDAVAARNHSPTAALGAGDPLSPGFGAAAAAGVAGDHPRHLHGHLSAQGCVQEVQGQIVTQVIALLGTRPAPTETASEPEDVPEDIAEGAENIGKIPEARKPGRRKALVAVSVIEAPLFRVVEDFVRLGGLLEALLGVFVAGITVRMIFEGYLPILLLDLINANVPRYSQDLIIILFLVCHILIM